MALNAAITPVPTKHLIADQGLYFTAQNPTIGTGIQRQALQTSFSDTVGTFVIQNIDAAKSIYLDYLRLILTGTAPATTVSMEFAAKLDNISRVPTGATGRTLLTNSNNNGASTTASIAQVYSFANAAAMTVPASSTAARTVARAHIATGLGITGDEYVLQFGGPDLQGSSGGATATRATDVARRVGTAAPIVIGPQGLFNNLVIYMWWLTETTTIPTFEFELGWWEK